MWIRFFLNFYQGLTPEEKTELENKLLGDCKDKEKASDDDVKTLMDRALPTTPTGKCLLACVHETIGLVRIGVKGQIRKLNEIKYNLLFLRR